MSNRSKVILLSLLIGALLTPFLVHALPVTKTCPSITDIQRIKTPLKYAEQHSSVAVLNQSLYCLGYLKNKPKNNNLLTSTALALKSFYKDKKFALTIKFTKNSIVFNQKAEDLLASAVTSASVAASIVNCKENDQKCFEENFKKCRPTKYKNSYTDSAGKQTTRYYEIIGLKDKACSIKTYYIKYLDSDWINKEMICKYDNTGSFETAEDGLDLDGCIGQLHDLMTEAQSIENELSAVPPYKVIMINNGPLNGYIVANSNNAILIKFTMMAGRYTDVEKLKIHLTRTNTSAMQGNQTIEVTSISNLRLIDSDTGVAIATGIIPSDFYTTNSSSKSSDIILTGKFDLTTNTPRRFNVLADIGDVDGMSFTADVEPVIYKESGKNQQVYIKDHWSDYLDAKNIIPFRIVGHNQTVQMGGVNISIDPRATPLSTIKGVGSFNALEIILTAKNISDIKIKGLKARIYSNRVGPPTNNNAVNEDLPSSVITAVYLFDGGSSLCTASLDDIYDGTHYYRLASFNNLNIDIPKGKTKKLIIKLARNPQATLRYVGVSVLGADVSAVDEGLNSLIVKTDTNAISDIAQQVYTKILDKMGTLTAVRDDKTPASDIIIAGSSDVIVSRIKFTATGEQFKINKLRVKWSDAGGRNSVTTIKIYPEGGINQSLSAEPLLDKYVDFTNVNWIIPAGTSRILTISVDLKKITQGPTPIAIDREIKFGVDYKNKFEAIGNLQEYLDSRSSINEIASDVWGDPMYLRTTKPTISLVNLEGAPPLISGHTSLLKLKVSADAQGPLTIKKLSFGVKLVDQRTGEGVLRLNDWTLCNAADPDKILAGTWSSSGLIVSSTGNVPIEGNNIIKISFEFNEEQEILAGNSKTLVLGATVDKSTPGDIVETNLDFSNDNAANFIIGGLSYHDTELVRLDNGLTTKTVDFLWSDKFYGGYHSADRQNIYKDWTSSYLITVPTAYSRLTR